MARALHDDREVAIALDGLVAIGVLLGSLPETLGLRMQLEQLHRQQHDSTNLAQDLTGRADLLIRLGRFDQAEEPLKEIEAAAAAGNQALASRARRVALLRAIAASESHDFAGAIAHAQDVLARSAALKSPDTTLGIAEALLTNARGALNRTAEIRRWTSLQPAVFSRELRYWRGVALLSAGDPGGAALEADAALVDIADRPSAEFEWRMTAIAAASARRRGDQGKATQMAERAQAALNTLRGAWKGDASDYDRRADLTELRRAAGIS